ncbi:MAG: GntR family transcriptional regulator [Saprospiraceae bacterium]|jgi:GntR family transcriptional regulator
MQQRKVEPLYQIVENYIQEQIQTGKLVPGDLVLSEPRLSNLLNVSQGTVKKAIENLTWQGVLFRHQGKGTFVSRIDFNNSLFRFFSYGDEKGGDVRIRKSTPHRHVEAGSAEICERLQVPAGTPLLYIERLGLVDQLPTFVEYCWWVASTVPGLEKEDIHIPDLFYALIVDQYDIPIVRAEETLTAAACGEQTAAKLEIEVNSPLVVLNRTTYTVNDKIVEVRTTKGRADRFSYRREIR